jgi:hypothetical protein
MIGTSVNPLASGEQTFAITLKLLDENALRVEFDGAELESLTADEAWPVGNDRGPAPSRLLGAVFASRPSTRIVWRAAPSCFRSTAP